MCCEPVCPTIVSEGYAEVDPLFGCGGLRFTRQVRDRVEVQKTMLGPEVLDSEGHQKVVFKSTGAESVGEGRWTLHGNLTLRGQTRPITVQVRLKNGRYTGEATVKQTDFGIKPPGKAGIRAKDEVRIEYDVRLAS
jgi:polyisoprenoid-binding protein YceI